jgi:hypothetical protein
MTAFLHLLTLKSQHLAKVEDESPGKDPPILEITHPTNPQSRAETLGAFPCIFLLDKG